MVEHRAREHESIHVRDRDANGHTPAERAEHATGGAAVEIQRVAGAAIVRGDDVRLAVGIEADVADEARVENAVDRFRDRTWRAWAGV